MNSPRPALMKSLSLILPAILFLKLICVPLPAQAQTSSTRSIIAPQDLEALFDPIFAEQMTKLHIPGAVVTVVKDGKILFTKGYGYADIEKKTPVIPDRTIFRIGSITKVFTAMAVVQLADRGRIKLDDDVNLYLKDNRVPNTYPQPITFFNLLTHTSGLDEISLGRRTSEANKVIPLGEFLKTRLVRRLPPNEVISYSTYNSALAGHLVEQITGTPFREYLRRNIFEPLGMSRTSITAIPENLQPDLARGYEYAENSYRSLPFQWFHTYPASDINSTATDMARLMIAHLQNGVYEGKRILSERAALEMQQTHFRNHPRLPGWCYGFYESMRNDLRIVEHGGSMDDGYSDLMSLLPAQSLGLYVACNTETGGFGLAEKVKTAMLDRYFPARSKPSVEKTKAPKRESLERFAGKYRWDIYCHSCKPDAGAYLPEPVEASVNADGTLSLFGEKWRQVEPLVFQLTDNPQGNQAFIAFRENAKGQITYMFRDTWAFERVERETK